MGTESTIIFSSDTGCTQNTICYNIGGIKNYNTQSSTIQIYPNPAQNNFTIEVSDNTKQTLTLFDIRGKLIFTQTITGTSNIDVSKLADGIYNINITGSTTVVNKKLIIVR